MPWTVRTLAEALGLRYVGDGDRVLMRVASLESAQEDSLAFVSRATFLERLSNSRAGAVVVAPEHASRVAGVALVAENPYAAYARAAQLLHPRDVGPPGEHESAVVDPSAIIGSGVSIGAQAVIEAGVNLGENVVVAARAFVGRNAQVGADTIIGPGVVIGHESIVGRRCTFQPAAVIGSDGFGFAQDEGEWVRIPQIGRVVIGDDVEVGANTTIDRGSLDDTRIGNGVILDNQIQVAHNVRIGDHTAMAGCVGIAGSAVIGARCTVGGAAVILGHLQVVDDVHITAMSLVTKSITLPGTYSSGVPLEPNAEWRRNAARFRQLDRLARRVDALEKWNADTSRGADDRD